MSDIAAHVRPLRRGDLVRPCDRDLAEVVVYGSSPFAR
jgi:hypothetical protein